ncbi:MAG: bifunctional [glutamine synthetase] adenylyltransferase/[glutamine synthetase]-adenylyl-L-tyrosine phosphorylase [Actinomycetales bacterium]|nr:bifunctional [glutamine synthetase] adenylyltransferase/[glutamine synthetase]-adenylyl-L-tyrosine phosphorylase [Actinomycetales bacterium]
MARAESTLTEYARLGFAELDAANDGVDQLGDRVSRDIVPLFAFAADPDLALRRLLDLLSVDPDRGGAVLDDEAAATRLIRVLGASEALGAFLLRRPEALDALREPLAAPLPQARAAELLRAAISGGAAADPPPSEEARAALRIAYRRELLRLAAWDLEQPDGAAAIPRVAAGLADLAGAALDAALELARRTDRFPRAQLDAARIAIIGMGKAGARELNYLSDVDVIHVAELAPGSEVEESRMLAAATWVAQETTRIISEPGLEPALWEVDANLRPEGKDGALVRSLESHVAYYERWAKGWEFQALLKARPLAGDLELGERYVQRLAPMVWTSAQREGFVGDVQRMRERVTAHIPAGEVDVQLKLGPGGLRDVEFTTQLLQLVHGVHDDEVRQRSTLDALAALADRGYIGRVEAAEFARDYRFLRLVEHRIQLSRLRRTHLMPREDEALRVLARATGLASTATGLLEAWQRTKIEVRGLHERLFYRPLLSAVAALPDAGVSLTSEQAQARLAAIGFQDPQGALRHIAALTGGVSRRAQIQRNLLPVLLQWFAEGADPDHGLLTFRTLSEDLGEAYWYLRMLRDSSTAAERLTQVLSGSRFVGVLFERIPEAAAWLEDDEELRPRGWEALREETDATVARYLDDPEAGAKALRTARRREVLRLALAGILGLLTIEELGVALSDVTTALLRGVLALRHRFGDGIEFGIVAMGRYGGEELGFGSDADVMYVYRAVDVDGEEAQRRAESIVHEIKRLTEDLRLPLDLDLGLRPEGKNGAIVRSLDSYRAYYERWSLTWEAQALLRARGAVGDEALLRDFESLADEIRYPARIEAAAVREVRRIKARVESERLPKGADPARHLKLGRGSLSDVEWFVQLVQLQRGHRTEGLRTTSTLRALQAAVVAGYVTNDDAQRLRAAWVIASRARSAMTLWTVKTADVLPSDRRDLEGVARLMEYPPGGASRFEEDYLRTTRLARQVFERGFYGPAPAVGGEQA